MAARVVEAANLITFVQDGASLENPHASSQKMLLVACSVGYGLISNSNNQESR